MSESRHHKTIVLSDIHLGSRWSKAKEVICFLKKNTCDTLILCGDIIDGWNLMRRKIKKWQKKNIELIKLLLEIQKNTTIIYVRGNHDDFLDKIIPVTFLNIQFVKEFIYTSGNRRYFVFHGDKLDKVTSRFKWLAKLGERGYDFSLYINRIYNLRRIKKGLPYRSLSGDLKKRCKNSVSFISHFEKNIIDIAHKNNCYGVICGHIHQPVKAWFEDILYLNSGDWVESLSALTEDYEGNWEIMNYASFRKNLKETPVRLIG